MACLEVIKLQKGFGGVQAVGGVDVEVRAGEIVALVGPNGAGKSTIFNLITGFLRPDRGIIRFKGKNIVGLRPDQIARRGIGRTFQSPLLFHGKTLLESLIPGRFRAQNTGFWQAFFNTHAYRQEQEQGFQKAFDTLRFLELTEWKDTLVSSLPCGMLRFMAIGQAMMSPVELLLLDEPLTGLNEEEMTKLLDRLRRLKEQGVTILIIEHHMKAIMAFCERIVVLNFGQKIAEGTPAEVRDNPTVIEAYLGRKRVRSNVS